MLGRSRQSITRPFLVTFSYWESTVVSIFVITREGQFLKIFVIKFCVKFYLLPDCLEEEKKKTCSEKIKIKITSWFGLKE